MAFAGWLRGGVEAVALNVQLTKIVDDWFEKKEISTSMVKSFHIVWTCRLKTFHERYLIPKVP